MRLADLLADRRALWLAAIAVTLWACATAPLISEECYYALYAKHLAGSYFDHPPMVAWLIRGGMELFGETELGLRALTALCGLATTWVGVRWLRELGVGARGECAWIVASLGVPALAAVRVVATPDAPLTCFYLAAAFALWRATRAPTTSRWICAGALCGLALLSKYSAVFLAVGLVAHLAVDREARARTKVVHVLAAAATALAVFSPVILWNAQHDWSSLRFQSEARYGGAHFSLTWPLVFVACQLVIAAPLAPWIAARSSAWAWRGDRGPIALAAYGLPLPLFVTLNAFFVQPKVHWAVPAYAPLALLAVAWWYAGERTPVGVAFRRATLVWLALSWSLCVLAPLARFVPPFGAAAWDPQRELVARIEQLASSRADAEFAQTFVFTDNHRDSAELAFELQRRSSQARVVLAQNALGIPARAFDAWDDPTLFVGWNALYALDRPEARAYRVEHARKHFESVERVDVLEFRAFDRTLRTVAIFLCRGYRGPACAGHAPRESR